MVISIPRDFTPRSGGGAVDELLLRLLKKDKKTQNVSLLVAIKRSILLDAVRIILLFFTRRGYTMCANCKHIQAINIIIYIQSFIICYTLCKLYLYLNASASHTVLLCIVSSAKLDFIVSAAAVYGKLVVVKFNHILNPQRHLISQCTNACSFM